MKNEFRKFNQKGFTLIEVLVSVAIIALLTGIFLAGYASNNNRSKVYTAAEKLASNLRMVEGRALGAQANGTNVPVGGWGIHFVNGAESYIIFAHNNNTDYNYDSGDENIQTIALPTGVTISLPIADTDIVFLPPDPTVYINDTLNGSADIKLADGQTTKTVSVNFFGLVEVK